MEYLNGVFHGKLKNHKINSKYYYHITFSLLMIVLEQMNQIRISG